MQKSKPVIGIHYGAKGEAWAEMMRRLLPDYDIRNFPDWGEVNDVDYAVAWKPPEGYLKRCVNLKAIFSIGAGVDQLLKDPDFPKQVPLIRMVDQGLAKGMAEYCTMAVLTLHRDLLDYQAYQREGTWKTLPQVQANDRRIGIMGMGQLGMQVIKHLRPFGFVLSGWSRTPKSIIGINCYAGPDELRAFLENTDILIILLPHTPETRGLINKDVLNQLPIGASVINAARGPILNIDDAKEILDTDHLKHLWLDVHHIEPLPDDHWTWRSDKVTVTPHIAAVTLPETAAGIVAEGIKTFEATGTAPNIVDLGRGY